MSGADDHWSAQAVRNEVVDGVRDTITDLEREDPEFSADFRKVATMLDPAAPAGDWSAVDEADDPAPAPGQSPGGVW